MPAQRFNRCTPQLPVKNLEETIRYYRDKLGFTGEWAFGNKDGGIRRDDIQLLFTEDAVFANEMNNDAHRLPLMWFVDNIEAILSEFKERGIVVAAELETHPYGLKEFAFTDINGYYVRVAEKSQ